jgi:hypothetical protein
MQLPHLAHPLLYGMLKSLHLTKIYKWGMEERHEMKIESLNHRLQAKDALNMLSLRQSPSTELKSKGYRSASLYRNAHRH